jgi:hypothetical protein
MKFFEDFIPVPEKFWSFETGESFKHCSLCNLNLRESGTPYLIEKAFNKTEVIFEYALCWECREKVMHELSQKSLARIGNYFEEHVDQEKRLKTLMNKQPNDPEDWIAHCLVKGTPLADMEEYQIGGQFVGGRMVLNDFPFALGGAAIDEIVELLSNETLGIMNDLSDKLFGIDLPNRLVIP